MAAEEPEYSGEEEDTDGESSGSRPDAGRSSTVSATTTTTSKDGITALLSTPPGRRRPSGRGARRRQQVARLSFVRKSPNRMLRPRLTSVSYTVRHDGRRGRGRKTSRKPGRRRKQTARPRTTTPLPPYAGQTLSDFCPSGRLVVTMSAVVKLSRCLGVDTDHWLRRSWTTMTTAHWSVLKTRICSVIMDLLVVSIVIMFTVGYS